MTKEQEYALLTQPQLNEILSATVWDKTNQEKFRIRIAKNKLSDHQRIHTVVPGTTIFVSTSGWKVCRVGQGTECDLFKDDIYVCTTPDESVAFRIKTAMRD